MDLNESAKGLEALIKSTPIAKKIIIESVEKEETVSASQLLKTVFEAAPESVSPEILGAALVEASLNCHSDTDTASKLLESVIRYIAKSALHSKKLMDEID